MKNYTLLLLVALAGGNSLHAAPQRTLIRGVTDVRPHPTPIGRGGIQGTLPQPMPEPLSAALRKDTNEPFFMVPTDVGMLPPEAWTIEKPSLHMLPKEQILPHE